MSDSILYYQQEIKLRKEMIDFLNTKRIEIKALKNLFKEAQKFEECARFRGYEKTTIEFIHELGGVVDDK